MTSVVPTQSLLIRVPANLARRVRSLLDQPSCAYADLSELVCAALENQLTLEVDRPAAEGTTSTEDSRQRPHSNSEHAEQLTASVRPAVDLLERPGNTTVATLPPARSDRALFVLTNRLSPFAVAARVLVNLTLRSGASPDTQNFIRETGQAARSVGLKLQGEDLRNAVPSAERRSTGWPVGQDLEKTLARFRTSFLLSRMTGEGPLVALGLVVVRDGNVHLTPEGLDLARAPSPLLEECSGWTLGTEQQAILRRSILAMPAESVEIANFIRPLSNGEGTLADLDKSAQKRHPDWTANLLVAHRAALIGRLRELGVIELTAGAPGRLQLPSTAMEFYRELMTRVGSNS